MNAEAVQRHLAAIKYYADKANIRLHEGDNYGIRDNLLLIESRIESIREEMYNINNGIVPKRIEK